MTHYKYNTVKENTIAIRLNNNDLLFFQKIAFYERMASKYREKEKAFSGKRKSSSLQVSNQLKVKKRQPEIR